MTTADTTTTTTLTAEQVFPPVRKREKQLEMTVADVFELTLKKLPPTTRLDLVYCIPETLNRENLTPQEVIDALTPIFRGQPRGAVSAQYQAYPERLHFIDLTKQGVDYAQVSILYDRKKQAE